MLVVQTNSERDQRGGFLWNPGLPVWLRKHGLIFKVAECTKEADDFLVSPGGVSRSLGSGFYEGPFGSNTLNSLGIGAEIHDVKSFDLYPAQETQVSSEPGMFEGICMGQDILRRIPGSRGERSDPYPWVPDDPALRTGTFEVQHFKNLRGFRVLAEAQFDGGGEKYPVIVTNGHTVLMGVPLFHLAIRKHWMPAVEDGYHSLETDPFVVPAETWLARLVQSAALEARASIQSVQSWPESFSSALTLRLDHDREISEESLESLLGFLASHNVKASWGFLKHLSPPSVIECVAARAHEIVLHTCASNKEDFDEEVAHFRHLECDIKGVTAHGGIGSAGHLGETYFDWAEDAGLTHADILSRHTYVPHPVFKVNCKDLCFGELMLPAAHHSLDIATAPDAHRLNELLHAVPERLALGGHVTLMNHPDIHREELQTLISQISRTGVWCATHAEVVNWIKNTRFSWVLDSRDRVTWPNKSPYSVEIREKRRDFETSEVRNLASA